MISWWIVDGPEGYVNWSPSYKAGARAVIPNRSGLFHTPDNLYNGDEVVALLDKFLIEVREQMTDAVFVEKLRKAFADGNVMPENLSDELRERLSTTRHEIHRVYRREWRRNACREELYALFSYCTCLCGTS